MWTQAGCTRAAGVKATVIHPAEPASCSLPCPVRLAREEGEFSFSHVCWEWRASQAAEDLEGCSPVRGSPGSTAASPSLPVAQPLRLTVHSQTLAFLPSLIPLCPHSFTLPFVIAGGGASLASGSPGGRRSGVTTGPDRAWRSWARGGKGHVHLRTTATPVGMQRVGGLWLQHFLTINLTSGGLGPHTQPPLSTCTACHPSPPTAPGPKNRDRQAGPQVCPEMQP